MLRGVSLAGATRWVTDSSGNVTGLYGPTGQTIEVPYVLAQSAVPVCLVSSGTMGNNGALSGITALQTTYSGGIWLRLPANAIQAGSAAGLYWAVMSSTTAGTVYNVYADPASAFTPYVPTTNTPFVSTGPGAFTQATSSDVTLVNITVPGAALGLNGIMRVVKQVSTPNNANAKTSKFQLGGTQVGSNLALTTAVGGVNSLWLGNRGAYNYQAAKAIISYSTSGTTGFTNIDTSIAKSFTLTGQLAVATDYLVIEGFNVEILPA